MRFRVTRRTGGIAVVTLLAAASAISQAEPARATTPSYQIAYASTGGELYTYQTGTGVTSDLGFTVRSGTNPGAGGGQVAAQSPVPGGYEVFIDPWPLANEGDGAEGVVYDDLTIPANSGTSPSVTYSGGTAVTINGVTDPPYVDAFNSDGFGLTNGLVLYPNNPGTGSAAGYITGDDVAAGTSPAIASDSAEWDAADGETVEDTSEVETAFQGTNGHLQEWQTIQTLSAGGTGTYTGTDDDISVQMAAGTSPAITADNYDTSVAAFAVAVQAADGDLVVYNDNTANVDELTGVEMAPNTSPAIASDGTSAQSDPSLNPVAHVEVAFQGSNGDLYTAVSSATSSSQSIALTYTNTGIEMAQDTSPAITYDDGGYQIAFEGIDNSLWLYNSATGATDTKIPMVSGSSPAIG
jgi:hypothetical protein